MTWRALALCIDHVDEHFPNKPGRLAHELAEQARARCDVCPVQAECLAECLRDELATPAGMRHGVTGGMTAAERAALEGRIGPQAILDTGPDGLAQARRFHLYAAELTYCATCGGPFTQGRRGRKALYCSMRCKEQARYRRTHPR
jgi:hypothetical protein